LRIKMVMKIYDQPKILPSWATASWDAWI